MLDSDLLRILKKNNIKVNYLDLPTKPGCLIVDQIGQLRLLLKSDLTEHEENIVARHELGHFFFDDDVCGDYSKDTIARQKMEHNADDYVIREMVAQYVLDGNDVETTNYVTLAYQIGTDNFNRVKKELLKYFNGKVQTID